MRWWMWAAGTVVVAALLALATVWALYEADVLRADQLTVVNTQSHVDRLCITYTVPGGGTQERCESIDRPPVVTCFLAARIGDPLPDCWR